MLNGKRERAGERRAAPTGNTSRRERRDEAAGTLSRVLGARTGAGRRLASKRERVALLPEEREGGRAGQGWGMGSSGRVSRPPRWQRLYLRAGVGRRCEAEGGAAARVASEGASRGEGGEGAAGSVSNRRRGGLGVLLAAAKSGAMRRGKRERTRKVLALPCDSLSPRRAFTQRAVTSSSHRSQLWL